VTQLSDSFSVRSAVTGEVARRGALVSVTGSDPASGLPVYRGDFSSFTDSGRWRIVTDAGDSSFTFTVADTVFSPVWRAVLKGFYLQRCGIALDASHAGIYAHPICHTSDGTFHSTAESAGTAIVTGGWHDAGDYGKYVVNAGISVGTLLMAYEYFPQKFGADDLGIPESENGTPDILDEVRWELSWLLKMQNANGGIFFKVTKAQFEGFIMPQNDTSPPVRYIYQLSSCATGDFAAVMARASREFRPFDATFADTCLSRARAAWNWLQQHPTIVPSGGFRNPSGTATGEYGDGNDADERLWAAAELFETTGESAYHTAYQQGAPSSGYFNSLMWWGGVGPMANITYALSRQPSVNTTIYSAARQSLLSQCQYLVNTKRNASGFYTALLPSEYGWGSNSGALNAAFVLLVGYREFATQVFEEAAADQLHYVLGANALGRSFVTGLGSRPPLQIHHRPSGSDGIANPVPGLIAGGPDRNREDPTLAALFPAGTPGALCYADTMSSYASNEIAINWNAPLVFVAGYFGGASGTQDVKVTHGSLPADFRLEQNYPNPFNGMTRITFGMNRAETVSLHVTDLLGRDVTVENLGTLGPGTHSVLWNARNSRGRALSTGAYFFYIAGDGQSSVRKMLLVR
jgi:endoglucanase